MSRVVTGGITYFADRTVCRLLSDRDFADWVEAFFETKLMEALARFDVTLAALPDDESPSTWKAAWVALKELGTELKALRNEYDERKNNQDSQRYLAEIQEQYSLI